MLFPYIAKTKRITNKKINKTQIVVNTNCSDIHYVLAQIRVHSPWFWDAMFRVVRKIHPKGQSSRYFKCNNSIYFRETNKQQLDIHILLMHIQFPSRIIEKYEVIVLEMLLNLVSSMFFSSHIATAINVVETFQLSTA